MNDNLDKLILPVTILRGADIASALTDDDLKSLSSTKLRVLTLLTGTDKFQTAQNNLTNFLNAVGITQEDYNRYVIELYNLEFSRRFGDLSYESDLAA